MSCAQFPANPRERSGAAAARALLAAALWLAALSLPALVRADDGGAGGAEVPAPTVQRDTRANTLRVTVSAAINRDDPGAIPQAYLEAETRARFEAVGALTAYVRGISTASGTIGERMDQDPALRTLVDSYVQGATLLEKRFLPGGRLELSVGLSLNGLSTILQP